MTEQTKLTPKERREGMAICPKCGRKFDDANEPDCCDKCPDCCECVPTITPEREAEIRRWMKALYPEGNVFGDGATIETVGKTICDELEKLRALLEPSPCNVEGHCRANCNFSLRELNIQSETWVCYSCLTLERLRERAFDAGNIWGRGEDSSSARTREERIAAIPLHDGGEK